jgi:hypothetical protein
MRIRFARSLATASLLAAGLIAWPGCNAENPDGTKTPLGKAEESAEKGIKKAEEVIVKDAKIVGEKVKDGAAAVGEEIKKDAKIVEEKVKEGVDKVKEEVKPKD